MVQAVLASESCFRPCVCPMVCIGMAAFLVLNVSSLQQLRELTKLTHHLELVYC